MLAVLFETIGGMEMDGIRYTTVCYCEEVGMVLGK